MTQSKTLIPTAISTAIPTALILGITGQDGCYLARYLLSLGYSVHGLIRRTSLDNRLRIADILPNLTLHEGDMADPASLWRIIQTVKPAEIYNLAAQSHVHTSFAQPEYTTNINALGALRVLEVLRTIAPQTRYYQASTSEIFGNSGGLLDEDSPKSPASPYAAAKLYAYHLTRQYRDSYGLFACNGILFNHESPVRGHDFVTTKIANFAAQIKSGTWNQAPLKLGNIAARRDWGHAADYVRGMHAMLNHEMPDDYVLATGTAHSVQDFANTAFAHIGQPLTWHGHQAHLPSGQTAIIHDPALLRPRDVDTLTGNAAKAERTLGWRPITSFAQLVADMVDNAAY